MMKWQNIINNKTIRVLDHSENNPFKQTVHPAISSFAIDDAIATAVGAADSPTTIRLWVHDETVVLGIPDMRLPYIEEGINIIKQHNFYPIVRNSGGLAVALDKGVLNISLIFPNNQITSIHSSYDMMFNFITKVLKNYTTKIQAYEIVGSFCPGDYDLSVDGIKFAGISQRRVRNGVSVQIYIDVCGNSSHRAKIVKDFYEISRKNVQTSYEYPQINSSVMGSLSELLDREISIQEIIIQINEVIKKSKIEIVQTGFTQLENDVYKKRLEQMIKRNDMITSLS